MFEAHKTTSICADDQLSASENIHTEWIGVDFNLVVSTFNHSFFRGFFYQIQTKNRRSLIDENKMEGKITELTANNLPHIVRFSFEHMLNFVTGLQWR